MNSIDTITAALTLAQGDFSRIFPTAETKMYKDFSVSAGIGVFNLEESIFYAAPVLKISELKKAAESFIYSQLEFLNDQAEQKAIDTGDTRDVEVSISIGDYAELEYKIYISKFIPPYNPDPTEQEEIEYSNTIEETKLITESKTYYL